MGRDTEGQSPTHTHTRAHCKICFFSFMNELSATVLMRLSAIFASKASRFGYCLRRLLVKVKNI